MKVTLQDIRDAADRKYGDFAVDLGEGRALVLRHALRLPKDQREKLFTLIETVESSRGPGGAGEQDGAGETTTSADAVETMIGAVRDLVRLIADRDDYAEILIDTVGDDLPMLLELFERYIEVAMPGEASPSDG